MVARSLCVIYTEVNLIKSAAAPLEESWWENRTALTESPAFPEEWPALAMGFLGQTPCPLQTWLPIALPLQVTTARPRPGFVKGFCRHFHIALLCFPYDLCMPSGPLESSWHWTLCAAPHELPRLFLTTNNSLWELSYGMGMPKVCREAPCRG